MKPPLFAGQRVTVVGNLIGWTHAELMAQPMMRGAVAQSRLSKRTQLLVLGEGGGRWLSNTASRARRLAESLNANGASIRILTFDQLLSVHLDRLDEDAAQGARATVAQTAWESYNNDALLPPAAHSFAVSL